MMERLSIYVFVLIAFMLTPCNLKAGDDDIWEAITPADWNVAPDSLLGIREAVMLFEKMTFDDRELDYDRVYITLYRRIRILNAEGRSWGDFEIPHIDKKQKIEKILGRTVLRDGSVFKLKKQSIIRSTLIKSKGIKVKQHSFSLPGITDDCIIEYYVKYRLQHPEGLWGIQKEIPLLYGELRWKYYVLQVSPNVTLPLSVENQLAALVNTDLTPNYLTRPLSLQVQVKTLPSRQNPEEFVFTIHNVKAFKSESFTLPDISLQARIICYYGGVESPWYHWLKTSEKTVENLDKFCKKNKRLRRVTATFDSLNSKKTKIEAAYNWCTKNIENVTYLESDKKSKKNKKVDDVIKNGYGTQAQINNVFYEMLRQMGFNPKMVFAVDRDENIFIRYAKYWQFHRSLVAVPDGPGHLYYSPGDLYLRLGEIPWVNEGTWAFMAGNIDNPFHILPFSGNRENRTLQKLKVRVDNDGQMAGVLYEEFHGHEARTVRLQLAQKNVSEQKELLKDKLQGIFKNAKIDSIMFENLDEISKPFKVSGKIGFHQPLTRVATRKIVKTLDYFEETTNPFQAEHRRLSLVFDYAYEQREILQIDVPENWSIQVPEAPSAFRNEVGYCAVTCTTLGKSLMVQYLFRLNQSFWNDINYPEVKELFQARQILKDLTIVLNENQ